MWPKIKYQATPGGDPNYWRALYAVFFYHHIRRLRAWLAVKKNKKVEEFGPGCMESTKAPQHPNKLVCAPPVLCVGRGWTGCSGLGAFRALRGGLFCWRKKRTPPLRPFFRNVPRHLIFSRLCFFLVLIQYKKKPQFRENHMSWDIFLTTAPGPLKKQLSNRAAP